MVKIRPDVIRPIREWSLKTLYGQYTAGIKQREALNFVRSYLRDEII